LDTLTAALMLTLLTALVGALAGAAGFAALIVGLQNRRLARIAERLARANVDSPTLAGEAGRIRDRRLRAAFAELADRVAQTWEQATFDPLTGIANRQTVLTRVEEELARAARYRRPLSLILVDLDHFKRFNDSHGHAAGDVILRHIAQLLAANVRGVDLAGRYGGEEFLVVLPETDPDAAASLAEKLRRIIGGTEIRLPDNEVVSVTLSAGVAGGPGDVLRLDALVRDADAALYSAKALGRNQVYVFRETGDEGTIRRAPITAEARSRAIDVGRAAMAAAQDALIATLAGRPAWGGKPSHDDRGRVGGARAGHRPPRRRARADPDGEPPPRPRQARDPRGDPGEARRPRRVRVARRDRAPEDRAGGPGAGGRPARRGHDRPPPP